MSSDIFIIFKYLGLIISGGIASSVEVFVPSTGQQCQLADITGDLMTYHIMENMTVCGGKANSHQRSCLTLTDGTWNNTATLLEQR